MEVRRRSSERRRGGLTIAGPLIFLLVVWFGAYFTWRIVHGDRAEQGVVTHVVYPDSRVGCLAHDVFTPLRWLDARYLGVSLALGPKSSRTSVQSLNSPDDLAFWRSVTM